MEERYRKLICPNGHSSEAIKENDVLPRRCPICRQTYLKNTKPVWCDINGNELEHEELRKSDNGENEFFSNMEPSKEKSEKRRRKTSFFDIQDSKEKEPEEPVTDTFSDTGTAEGIYYLVSGDFCIELSGEGILGREYTGKEILAVNRLVSRKHCFYIATIQRGLQIRDAGSLNGTFADTGAGRVAIGKDAGTGLKPGDKLWLADMLFEVREVV